MKIRGSAPDEFLDIPPFAGRTPIEEEADKQAKIQGRMTMPDGEVVEVKVGEDIIEKVKKHKERKDK